MKCIYCGDGNTKVIDSRESEDSVRRRRECGECGERFTTYETAEELDVKVVKEDGSEESFKEDKIRNGVEKAANKTQIDQDDVEEVVESVKKLVRGKKEIKSKQIGEKIKEKLKKKDEVAYIRFASVYDSFEDAESFKKEVEVLNSKE